MKNGFKAGLLAAAALGGCDDGNKQNDAVDGNVDARQIEMVRDAAADGATDALLDAGVVFDAASTESDMDEADGTVEVDSAVDMEVDMAVEEDGKIFVTACPVVNEGQSENGLNLEEPISLDATRYVLGVNPSLNLPPEINTTCFMLRAGDENPEEVTVSLLSYDMRGVFNDVDTRLTVEGENVNENFPAVNRGASLNFVNGPFTLTPGEAVVVRSFIASNGLNDDTNIDWGFTVKGINEGVAVIYPEHVSAQGLSSLNGPTTAFMGPGGLKVERRYFNGTEPRIVRLSDVGNPLEIVGAWGVRADSNFATSMVGDFAASCKYLDENGGPTEDHIGAAIDGEFILAGYKRSEFGWIYEELSRTDYNSEGETSLPGLLEIGPDEELELTLLGVNNELDPDRSFRCELTSLTSDNQGLQETSWRTVSGSDDELEPWGENNTFWHIISIFDPVPINEVYCYPSGGESFINDIDGRRLSEDGDVLPLDQTSVGGMNCHVSTADQMSNVNLNIEWHADSFNFNADYPFLAVLVDDWTGMALADPIEFTALRGQEGGRAVIQFPNVEVGHGDFVRLQILPNNGIELPVGPRLAQINPLRPLIDSRLFSISAAGEDGSPARIIYDTIVMNADGSISQIGMVDPDPAELQEAISAKAAFMERAHRIDPSEEPIFVSLADNPNEAILGQFDICTFGSNAYAYRLEARQVADIKDRLPDGTTLHIRFNNGRDVAVVTEFNAQRVVFEIPAFDTYGNWRYFSGDPRDLRDRPVESLTSCTPVDIILRNPFVFAGEGDPIDLFQLEIVRLTIKPVRLDQWQGDAEAITDSPVYCGAFDARTGSYPPLPINEGDRPECFTSPVLFER